MIWIKTIILLCLSPLLMSLGLMALGTLCLWSNRRPALGRVLTGAGLLLLIWAAYGHFGRGYLTRLESQYSPLNPASLPPTTAARARFVVILGAGQVSDPRLPVTSQIGDRSLYRLVEGIRIHRHLPGSKLVLVGGPGTDNHPNAEVMAAVAIELGLRQDDLIVMRHPRDTIEEARCVKKLVDNTPFVLVTSAAHMPRAMQLFQREGLHPIPAPTNYACPITPNRNPAHYFPTPGGLGCTEHALYEMLGSFFDNHIRR